MSSSTGRISKRLIISYIIDWIIIIVIAAVGAAFSIITPNRRPFDITNRDISYPLVTKEKVPTGVLAVIGLIIPAVIIFIICMSLGTGPTNNKEYSRAKALKRKLWELNASWLGLVLSLAIAFFLTNGSKNLFGKPRPNLLARCHPDLSKILESAVGGIGDQGDEGINLVSWTICRTPGPILDEGFRSYPSGHSSFSFAGMTYLALFFCAKLAIAIPFLNYQTLGGNSQSSIPPRRQAAAPPTYLLVFPLVPICVAIYVCSTRYSDFMHHGFDIFSGAILGIASGWLGFRWYHLPISRGGGWAWAPRSPGRAFGRGIGTLNYAKSDPNSHDSGDLEPGYRHTRSDAAVGNGHMRQFNTSNGSEDIPLNDLTNPELHRGIGYSQRPLR